MRRHRVRDAAVVHDGRRTTRARRRTESGDTLVEVLLALVVLGLASVALIVAFGTTISASADHRSLATINTILSSASQSVIASAQQSTDFFATCSTVSQTVDPSTGTSSIAPVVPGNYSATYTTSFVTTNATQNLYPVQYWNGSSFQSTCPTANLPGGAATWSDLPVMLTIQVTKTGGETYYTSFVVAPPGTLTGSGASASDVTPTAIQFVLDPSSVYTDAAVPEFSLEVIGQHNAPVVNDLSAVTLSLQTTSGGSTTATLWGCQGTENAGYIYFQNCMINASATQTLEIVATDTSDLNSSGNPLTATSPSFTVTLTNDELVFLSGHEPVGGVSGKVLTTSPEVAVVNISTPTTPITGWTGTITITASGGLLTCPAGSNGAVTNGYSVSIASTNTAELTLPSTCTFAGGIRQAVGQSGTYLPTSYVMNATATPTGGTGSSSVSPAVSTPFSVSSWGSAYQLVFSQEPVGADGGSGSTFTESPQVTIEDSYGNVVYGPVNSVDNSTDSITLKLNGSGNTFGCTNTTVSASKGVATFSGCEVTLGSGHTVASGLTLTATDTTTPSVLSATSSPGFNITPAPNLLVFAQQPQAGASGATMAQMPVVDIYYSTNGTTSGTLTLVTAEISQITLQLPTTGPSGGSLNYCSNLAPVAGAANVQTCQFAGLVGTEYQMEAEISGVTTWFLSNQFEVTGPGVPTQLAYETTPTTCISGGVCSPAFDILVEDSAGNLVTTSNATVTLAASTGATWSPACSTIQAISGVANAGSCTISGTGGTNYTMSASSPGLSSPTNSVNFEMLSPPLAPASAPLATAASASTVNLSWSAPTNNGGESITGYQVEATDTTQNSTSTVCQSSSTSTATSCTAIQLVTGDSYTFSVAAINGLGVGSLSPSSSTVSLVPPAAPIIGAVSGVSPTALSVAWTGPTDAASIPAVTSYSVYYSSNGGATWTTFTTTAATSPVTVSGLSPGLTYEFEVAATNVVNTGPSSAASTAVTLVVPNPPIIGTATAGNSSVSVAWTAPTSNGGPAITSYVIQYSTSPYTSWTTASSTSPTTCTASPCTVTGLTNGTTYEFQVAAVNAVGSSSYSSATNTATPATVPSAPAAPTVTNVTGVGYGANPQVTVSWTAPATGGSSITGYDVLYSTSATGPYTSVATGSTTTNYTFTSGLTAGTQYYFEVAAINAIGTGANSSYTGDVPATEPNATATAPTVTNVTGVGYGANPQVKVAWTAPATGGSSITGYDVLYSTSATGPYTSVATGSTTTNYTFTSGLTAGTQYYFEVAAINAIGTGANSSYTGDVPATEPNVPTLISGTSNANAQSVVTWTAPTNTGGSPITGYAVSYGTSSTGPWTTATTNTSSTSTSYTVTGLTNGTPYYFEVAAINAIGTGGFGVSTNTATPATVPSAPAAPTVTNVTGVGYGANPQVTVSWTAPATGGSSITGYDVLYSTSATGPYTSVATGSTTTNYTFTSGLTAGTQYYFEVAAINAIGTGANSSYTGDVPATEPNATATAPTVTNVTGVGYGANPQVKVAWTAPATGGSSITGYDVLYSTSATGPYTSVATGSTTTNYTFTSGLTAGTQYYFEVAAINAIGTGANSSYTGDVPATEPNVPTLISGTSNANAQSVVTWTAPTNTGGSPITGYAVSYGTSSTGPWTTATTNTSSTSTSYTVTGLTNGTPYYFEVAAINAIGTGGFGVSTNTATPATVPSAPTSVTAQSYQNQSSTVAWSAPASNGGSAITDYVVQYATAASCATTCSWTTASSTITGTSYTVTGLKNGVTYEFEVAAINGIGTGAFSASASATPATVPGAPTGVTATSHANAQSVVSWTAPVSNGGAAISLYTVTSSPGGFTCTSAATSCTVTGLSNGTAYTFTVTATNGAGTGPSSAASRPATPSTTPSAPTSVTASIVAGLANATTSSIQVTWAPDMPIVDTSGGNGPGGDGGSAITNYSVAYSSNSGSTWSTAVTATAPSTTFTGLTTGTTYEFEVIANNANGSSNATTTTGTPLTVPAAPTGVTAQIATGGSASAKVSWTAAGLGGAAQVEYTVTSNTGNLVCTTSTTSCTVSGLVSPTGYSFTVTATNLDGTGVASSASSLVYLEGSTVYDSSGTYTWTAPEGVSQVSVVAVGGGGGGGDAATATAGGNSYFESTSTLNAAGGAGGTATTGGAGGTTANSSDAGATTPRGTEAGGNGGAGTASYGGGGGGAGGWSGAGGVGAADDTTGTRAGTASTGGGGGGGGVLQSTAGAGGGGGVGVYATATSNGTGGGTTSTTNGGGGGTGGGSGGHEGQGGQIPTSPTGLTAGTTTNANGGTSGGGDTSGSTTTNAGGGGAFGGGGGGYKGAGGGGGALAYGMVAVTPGTTYTVVVGAGGAGAGSASGGGSGVVRIVWGTVSGTVGQFPVTNVSQSTNESVNTSPASTPPGSPTAIAASSNANGQSVVSWTAPATTGYPTSLTYTVQYSADGGNTWTTASSTATSPYTVTGLTNGTTYLFQVLAVNTTGSSGSAMVSATPAAVPGAPTGVLATSDGNGSSVVSWAAPASSGGSPITLYTVTSTPGGYSCTTSTLLTCTVSGLSNGTSYTFTVVATNAVGNSSASTASASAIPATVPGAPTAVGASAGVQQVTVTWTAPASNGGVVINDYVVQFSSNGGSTWSVATELATGTNYVVAGLTTGTAYEFEVAAVNAAGEGAFSTTATATPN